MMFPTLPSALIRIITALQATQIYQHLSPTRYNMASFPSTVQAVSIQRTGDFDVIEKARLPFPKEVPGNLVVKVDYFGVNFIDTYFRKGMYPLKDFPAVLGMEAAGTIAALPTDEKVLNDPDFKKRNYTIGSKVIVNNMGVHQTYISIPWSKAHPVPASVDTKIAAAAGLQALTALTFFTEAYNVKQGDVILVHTVAGGLGLLMAQLGKYRGATVIGTTSTKEKAEIAKAHGVDHVILYTSENTAERVLELTNGEGVHAVFDGVGKDTFEDNFKLLRRKGTFVSVGNASGPIAPFSPLKLIEKNLKFLRPSMPNYIATPEESQRYVTEGILKINIYKTYPFTAEAVQQAQKDLTGGKTTGKLVIDAREQ
ncbi:hypothetical protein EDD18DRAFT_1145765 [Armillaria luteobubalina]|uniref:Probable quinone oxidoreductase n=1 Tax=Armillaria luteobubalina TaxID=153913 RepID=A0AA39QEU4_9AGAR|nr:hypothetical protein EDD18DRAFT_1145765 [Armillaria luteobubalina]